MPWDVVPNAASCPAGKPFGVRSKGTDKIIGCHPTRTSAADQVKALYSNVRESGLTTADLLALEATPVEEKEFSAKRRAKLADEGKALPGGGFPIESAQDLANAIQAIGRASDPAAAKAHIIRRAKALGLTASLPDDWKVREAKGDQPKMVFGRANKFYKDKGRPREYEKNSPYRPDASAAQVKAEMKAIAERAKKKFGKEPTQAQVEATFRANQSRTTARMKRAVDKDIKGIKDRAKKAGRKPKDIEKAASATYRRNREAADPWVANLLAQPNLVEPLDDDGGDYDLTPLEARLIAMTKEASVEPKELTTADLLAIEAAGFPVPATEAGKGDHFYGSWKGGKAKSGGGPDKNSDGKVDAKADAKSERRSGGERRAKRAPQLPKSGGFSDPNYVMKSASTAKSRGGPGYERQSRWLGSGEQPWSPTGRPIQHREPKFGRVGESYSPGDTEVRALQVIGEGEGVSLKEAVILLDKAPTTAKVIAVGDDVYVMPEWTGSFDTLYDAYEKPEPYRPEGDWESVYDVGDAAELLRSLVRLKRDEKGEGDQPAMLQTAVDAVIDFIRAEADEIGESDADVEAELVAEALAESMGGEIGVAMREVGKRHSAKDASVLKQIGALLAGIGIDLSPDPADIKADDDTKVEPVAEAAVDPDAAEIEVRFNESEAGAELILLSEAAPSFDADNKTVWITPIRPGWGNTRDNNYYPTSVLHEATTAGAFNHRKMYRDHPRKSDEKDLPERSVKDWFATTREAVWDDTRQKPRVPILVHDESDFRRMQEAPEQVAFSIIGGGLARPGEKDGRKGRILESISKVQSIDWVTEAGAGGGIDFAESGGHSEENEQMDNIEDLTAEELAEGNPELYKRLVGLGKALAAEDREENPTAKPTAKPKDEPAVEPAKAETAAKESEVPAWAAPILAAAEKINAREAETASAATLDDDKKKAAKVVTDTLAASTLVGRAKDVIKGAFAEAAVGEGRAYADEAALKGAIETRLTEAETILGKSKPGSNVVGLGEGAATAGEPTTIAEAIKGGLDDKFGPSGAPAKDQLVFTAAQVAGMAPATPIAGPDVAAVSEAGAAVQAGIAVRMGQ